jgi:MFS family permease
MVALLPVGFAVSSVGNLLTGLAWAVAAAFAVQTVRGFGIAAMDVAANTLLQRLVPAEMLGRVFGNLYGAIGVAAGLSYVGGGLLLDATSAPATFLIAGTAGTLATLAVARALPRTLRASGDLPPAATGDLQVRAHAQPGGRPRDSRRAATSRGRRPGGVGQRRPLTRGLIDHVLCPPFGHERVRSLGGMTGCASGRRWRLR